MANMQSEAYEAFRSMDIPEDKAVKAAGALAKRDDDVISIKGDIVSIKADLQVVKTEMPLLKWLLGIVLAFVIAIALKLFVH